MIDAHRLLLVNHLATDLIISLPHSRGPRQPTLACKIPANHAINVCTLLDLTRSEARKIVEQSQDYIHFRARRWLELVDPITERQERAVTKLKILPSFTDGVILGPPSTMSPEEYELALDKMIEEGSPSIEKDLADAEEINPIPGGDPLPSPELPPIINRAADRLAEEHRQVIGAPPIELRIIDHTAPIEDAHSEPDVTEPAPALDLNAKMTLLDTTPSTRWNIDQLREHATKRGIDTTGMSKNAILRKLRSGS